MIPVGAPRSVLARLRRAADGPLHVLHRGPDAVYLGVGDRCVGLLGRRAVAVPCGLRSRLATVDVGVAELVAGVLHVDGEAVVVGRLVDVRVPRLRGTCATPAPTPDVWSLLGQGEGLTPYGDDVLCGWVAAHRAAGVATPEADAEVRAGLHRTTVLSATLLDHALHAEVVPPFATWLAACGTPAEPAAERALRAVGHSSGAGLLAGARTALRTLAPALVPTHPTSGAA